MKNKVYIIIIVVLAIALCGTSGYIVYDKVLREDSKKDQEVVEKDEDEPKVEVVSLSENDVSKYSAVVDGFTLFYANQFPLKDVDTISKEDILVRLWDWSDFRSSVMDVGSTFDASQLRKVADQYFGEDYKYDDKDIICFAGDGVLYSYDENTKQYTRVGYHGHDGGGYYVFRAFFQDAKEEGDVMTINYKILYYQFVSGSAGPGENFYPTAKDLRNRTNGLYDYHAEAINSSDYEKAYSEFSSKIPVTSFVFQKDHSGNYGLKSVVVS